MSHTLCRGLLLPRQSLFLCRLVTEAFGARRGLPCLPAHVGRLAHGRDSTEVMLQIGRGAALDSPPALVNPGNGSPGAMGKGIGRRVWTERPGLQSGPKETLGCREVTPTTTTAGTQQAPPAEDVHAPAAYILTATRPQKDYSLHLHLGHRGSEQLFVESTSYEGVPASHHIKSVESPLCSN